MMLDHSIAALFSPSRLPRREAEIVEQPLPVDALHGLVHLHIPPLCGSYASVAGWVFHFVSAPIPPSLVCFREAEMFWRGGRGEGRRAPNQPIQNSPGS